MICLLKINDTYIEEMNPNLLPKSQNKQKQYCTQEKSHLTLVQKKVMSSIPDELSAFQLSIIEAQTNLDKLDRPDSTIEELREYENNSRILNEKLKKLSQRINMDRSANKESWQR